MVDDTFLIELNNKLETEEPLNEDDLVYYTDKLFNYYRIVGFPNYEYDINNVLNKFKLISSLDSSSYYDADKKIYKKYASLNGFLFSYFPHWIDVECGNSGSLKECWNNDDILKKLIRKTLIWLPKHHEVWTSNRIRQLAKVFGTGQSVSNFNSVAAKMLYDEFGNCGTILDMCCGWGGRLLGFIGSNCNKYIGYEVSEKTFEGLNKIKEDYNRFYLFPKDIELHKTPCEELELEENSIDFAFTSPPYFDCEKYSNDEEQSYLKYPQRELWTNNFLGETFSRVYKALKPNCYMAINIASSPKNNWIEEDCVRIAKEKGFIFEDTRYYEISNIGKGDGNKLEPIFIFKKER